MGPAYNMHVGMDPARVTEFQVRVPRLSFGEVATIS